MSGQSSITFSTVRVVSLLSLLCGVACTEPSALMPVASRPIWKQHATPVIYRDIIYDSPGGHNNRLDIHLARPSFIESITILYIHGGGWLAGDKSEAAELLEMLAEAGFSVVTCNYTLATIESPGYPQAVYDVKAVVRWIRTEGARQYGLSEKIAVVGESAGGYLALMLGTTDGIGRFEPQLPYPGTYRVDAVIAFFAPGDLIYQAHYGFDWFSTAWFLGGILNDQTMPLYIEASPITYINESNPPMALLHGWLDDTVPFEESVRWCATFASVCRSCQLIESPLGGHGLEAFGGNAGACEEIRRLIPQLLTERRKLDLNGDGQVNRIDVELIIQILTDPDAYFANHPGCSRLQADQNGDGFIDARDLALMASLIVVE